jgi:hypothetical protein
MWNPTLHFVGVIKKSELCWKAGRYFNTHEDLWCKACYCGRWVPCLKYQYCIGIVRWWKQRLIIPEDGYCLYMLQQVAAAFERKMEHKWQSVSTDCASADADLAENCWEHVKRVITQYAVTDIFSLDDVALFFIVYNQRELWHQRERNAGKEEVIKTKWKSCYFAVLMAVWASVSKFEKSHGFEGLRHYPHDYKYSRTFVGDHEIV